MVERARHEGTHFLADADPPVAPYTLEQHPDIVATVRAMMSDATPVGVMVAQRAAAARKDSGPLLASIDVPVVVIQGEDDPIVPRVEAEALAAAIPGAVYISIAGAGHLPPIEQPLAVNDALRVLTRRSF